MSESKRYWYIQLNVNFFDDERIDWLGDQENGYAYIVLYLKLCLKTANNNGILTRQIGTMIIPYTEDKIAEVTHMDIEIVRAALDLYKQIGLIYEADETCSYMRLPDVPSMVGSTTIEAIRKAKYREKLKMEAGQPEGQPEGQTDGQNWDNVPQEIRDKSLELIDNSDNKRSEEKVGLDSAYAESKQSGQARSYCIPFSQIQEMYNTTCIHLPKCQALSDRRKKAIKARFENGMTIDDFKKVFEKAEASSFLRGKNDRDWQASFDWLIKDANMVKVLDGNYDNRGGHDYGRNVGAQAAERNPNGRFEEIPGGLQL